MTQDPDHPGVPDVAAVSIGAGAHDPGAGHVPGSRVPAFVLLVFLAGSQPSGSLAVLAL